MKNRILLLAIAVLTFAAISIGTVPVFGQPYEISWYTIDGGGDFSDGGNYELAGTIGQNRVRETIDREHRRQKFQTLANLLPAMLERLT